MLRMALTGESGPIALKSKACDRSRPLQKIKHRADIVVLGNVDSSHGVGEIAMTDEEVRVVVVDDSEDAAAALSQLLALDGYTVMTAHSGEEAVALIADVKPHCVLLDIGMPGIDGYDLAMLLRQQYADDIVLIAVTGWDTQLARVADTFAVVDHYFQKPVQPAELRKLLRPLGRVSADRLSENS